MPSFVMLLHQIFEFSSCTKTVDLFVNNFLKNSNFASLPTFQKQSPKVFYKNTALENSTIFDVESFFLIKLQA